VPDDRLEQAILRMTVFIAEIARSRRSDARSN
jgi:hypothetical protein